MRLKEHRKLLGQDLSGGIRAAIAEASHGRSHVKTMAGFAMDRCRRVKAR